jgi:hypothetical protein
MMGVIDQRREMNTCLEDNTEKTLQSTWNKTLKRTCHRIPLDFGPYTSMRS